MAWCSTERDMEEKYADYPNLEVQEKNVLESILCTQISWVALPSIWRINKYLEKELPNDGSKPFPGCPILSLDVNLCLNIVPEHRCYWKTWSFFSFNFSCSHLVLSKFSFTISIVQLYSTQICVFFSNLIIIRLELCISKRVCGTRWETI